MIIIDFMDLVWLIIGALAVIAYLVLIFIGKVAAKRKKKRK